MNDNSAHSDIAFIRISLLEETLHSVEKLPYPGEIQSRINRRSSLLRLSELLYSVCGGEQLPSFTPDDAAEQKKPESSPQTEKAAVSPETSADARAIMDFFGKAGENILRSAAGQAARTGRVNTDTAKRAAVSGIAQTISMMMREDRDK